MTEQEIVELAHRMAWRFRKSSDPHHSDTFTFNRSTLLELSRKLVEAEREACATICKKLADCEENTDGYRSGAAWCREQILARSNTVIHEDK